MPINAEYLVRCIDVLETAFGQLLQYEPDEITYDIYRAACVKEFELVLEQSGRLLRMRLRDFFSTNMQADRLAFKDVFRHAAKHGLVSSESCERWLEYRDNRNDTAHDYGEGFAETTLKLLPNFIVDARELASVVQSGGQEGGNG
jgi:nucleotidyltransferase substrate binding protein (TIGR01987 family)